MKKKLLSMTLGMMLVISAAVPAMAAEKAELKEFPATAITIMAVESVEGEGATIDIKEGVNVSILIPEKTEDGMEQYLLGTISKEDATTIMNDLGWSDTEKEAFLKDFDQSMDKQKEMYSLYAGELTQDTMDKAAKLRDDAQSIFNEAFLNKAKEKGLFVNGQMAVMATEASVGEQKDMAELKVELIEIKDTTNKEDVQTKATLVPAIKIEK